MEVKWGNQRIDKEYLDAKNKKMEVRYRINNMADHLSLFCIFHKIKAAKVELHIEDLTEPVIINIKDSFEGT